MENTTPKYMELVNWISAELEKGALKPGEKLYSENELKDMFGVSRQTVRHAVSILENNGILRRVQGSGTYINEGRRAGLEKRTRVAVVTTYVDGYIFPRTIQGIENVLFEHGYTVEIAFTGNHNSRERTILEDIIRKDEAAGIIVETTKSGIPNPNLHLYHEIRRKKIPVLFINSYYPLLKIPHVSINDRMAGYKITRHLLAAGHRKIGGVFKLDDGQGHLRYAGYVEALTEKKIEVDDTRVVWVDTEDVRHLEKSRDRILERLRECTAVACYNDEVAFSLVPILRAAGRKVPEDVSLASIDDSDLAVSGGVRLTSVPHPMERLGERAAENLLRMVKEPSFDGNYEFDAELVRRNSVKKIK